MGRPLKVAKDSTGKGASLYAQLQKLGAITLIDFFPGLAKYEVNLYADIVISLDLTDKSFYYRIGELIFFEQQFEITPAAATQTSFWVKLPVQTQSAQVAKRGNVFPVFLSLETRVSTANDYLNCFVEYEERENQRCVRIDKRDYITGFAANYAAAAHEVHIRGAYFV